MNTFTTSGPATLDWGGGLSADLVDCGKGRFELHFTGTIPPTKKIKIDAVDQMGKCRPLIVSSLVQGNVVTASGQTEGAYRARVYIMDDSGPLTREVEVPGATPMKYVRGPEGGALIFIGHDGESATAEVLDAGPGKWRLTFEDEGKKIKAPRIVDVEVQAIAPASGENQVRNLAVETGPDTSSLILSGEIAGATHIRLAIRDGNHWHTRCVPVVEN